ncbi:unnamed protein product [Gordionus sp. m RMFG-2023]|uniref:PI-actitoxin-Afv2b-like n=1 Tax=Gordionus sp. m RMFG-2023 TaxID=3053472 RepID=UPI0030E20BBE
MKLLANIIACLVILGLFDHFSKTNGSDVCHLPVDPGPCEALVERWYYNAGEGKCLAFNYGGCRGNGNNFSCRGNCQRACIR